MKQFLEDFLVFPEYWPVLLIMLPIGAAVVIAYIRSIHAIKTWFSKKEYSFFLPEPKLVLRLAGLLFLALAITGPYWGRMEQQISKLGREVYFLVDVSASMKTEDLKPTRLEKVRKEIKRMITQLKGDRMGLIVFTSDAYVQCPLTTDQKAIMMMLDLIGSYQFSNTGTSFRDALSKALDRFVNVEKQEKKVTRSIVLFSDGEDFGENYTSVVKGMKDNDIHLFTVGVGTYEGGQVPHFVNGVKRGYKKTKEGDVAVSVLKDEVLKNLADEFGSEYYTMDDQLDNLDPVINQIKLLSATVLDKESRLTSVNKFQLFLGISVVCLILSMFSMPFSVRQSRKETTNSKTESETNGSALSTK